MFAALLLLLAIAVEVAATALLPKADGFRDPLWSLAVIAGGGAAAGVQGATTLARHVSSWTTMGLGNHLLSTGEAAGSVLLSALSLVAPLFAAAAVAALGLIALAVLIKRPWQQRPAT